MYGASRGTRLPCPGGSETSIWWPAFILVSFFEALSTWLAMPAPARSLLPDGPAFHKKWSTREDGP